MATDESVWVYNASLPLAIIGCVVYGLLLIAIAYVTWIRYRAWYFTVVVIGAIIEVVGYVCRAYSVAHDTVLVSMTDIFYDPKNVPWLTRFLCRRHSYLL